MQPPAEADQRPGSAVQIPNPVEPAPPAAQRPGIGQMPDRLLHQRAQPGLAAVVGPLPVGEPVLGRRSPTGACQCSRRLAMPRNPRSSRLATPLASSTSSSPDSVTSSCSWQLPGQPPSHHKRSPWAVWAWRLVSYQTFWLAHPRGRCTRVASPSTKTASPVRAISPRRSRRSAMVVMNVPSGWQYPSAASPASSRSMLSPTRSWRSRPSDRPAGRTVIQQDRGDGVQADLQGQRWVATDPWRSRWQQVGQAAGQVGEDRGGQRRMRAV